MVNVLNPAFTSYVNYLKTGLAGGQLALKTTNITVNLDGLKDNLAQYNSAKEALALWSATTGLTFTQVTGNTAAKITFNNDNPDAAYTTWSGGGAKIDVAQGWMAGWPVNQQWGTGSYGLQTFVHEIGHALGLSHGGPYNGTGQYATDRLFDIDTWQYSVMSYYDQTNYKPNAASFAFLNGPMIADIAAIQGMYGTLAVNAGNTVFGKGSLAMEGVTDFGRYSGSAFTIHDTSGDDTFDLSNATRGSMIDLRPGSFSDINGKTGNVAITADTVIERVFGTSFSDTIHGNEAANTMHGNAGNDVLYGYGGNDAIYGDDGNDTLAGGLGDDLLDGGLGADTMRGGSGDDSYLVDNAADVVDELNDGGAGIDTVFASITLSLGSATLLGSVENLTLTGTADLDGTGNTLANVIFGNSGNNHLFGNAGNDTLSGGLGNDVLDGGSGVDLMTGGAGNDSYYVDNAADIVDELSDGGAGIDTIYSSIHLNLGWAVVKGVVENLTLTGTANINGAGNALANTIIGNSGNNILYGGGGNDTLTGGAGKDVFVFDTALNATTNVDKITDFSVVDDTISLAKSIFTALGAKGELAASAFVSNLTGLATHTTDRIIYNSSTGSLYYDADGSGAGAAVKFADIGKSLAVSYHDFMVA